MAALPSGGHAGVAQVSVAQVSPYKARVLYVGVLEYTLPACLRLPDDTVGRLKIRIAEVDATEVGAAQIQPPFFDSPAAAHLIRAAKDHGYRCRYIGRQSRQALV